MIFSTITFLYYFLPLALMAYFLVPSALKNLVLVVASLIFYAWGEPKYVYLMIALVIIGYIAGIVIYKYRGKALGKVTYLVSLLLCFFALGFFKYTDFFIESFSRVTGISVKLLGIALPIGISFYVFQLVSYLVEVKREKVPPQKNIINMFAYVTMFPQLIAGPIVRYNQIEKQLVSRSYDLKKIRSGITRFSLGLGKKVLIANQLAELCDIIKASQDKSILFMWIFGVATALYIYYDFSGYSDMAIGLGRVLGFDFPENFNYPFISGSITEFWRRWHMTLGGWFRDYVYIPMGGNRVGVCRLILNILTVWMLTGLWHGAAANFLLWGLMFGVILLIEKLWLGKKMEKTLVLKHVYVLLLLVFTFVIFAADNVGAGFEQIGGMFGLGGLPLSSLETKYYFRSYISVLLMAVLGATPLIKDMFGKLKKNISAKWLAFVEPALVIAILALSTAYIVDGSFNPFLYFRF